MKPNMDAVGPVEGPNGLDLISCVFAEGFGSYGEAAFRAVAGLDEMSGSMTTQKNLPMP